MITRLDKNFEKKYSRTNANNNCDLIDDVNNKISNYFGDYISMKPKKLTDLNEILNRFKNIIFVNYYLTVNSMPTTNMEIDYNCDFGKILIDRIKIDFDRYLTTDPEFFKIEEIYHNILNRTFEYKYNNLIKNSPATYSIKIKNKTYYLTAVFYFKYKCNDNYGYVKIDFFLDTRNTICFCYPIFTIITENDFNLIKNKTQQLVEKVDYEYTKTNAV